MSRNSEKVRQYFHQLATDQDKGEWRDRCCKTFLTGLSGLYLAGVRADRFRKTAFQGAARRLPAPTISVGNLTVGGSGKTPLVARIARYLIEKGWHPVVLQRGYRIGENKHGSIEESDEALMLREQLPGADIITGKDRRVAARNFLASAKNGSPVVFILDDGFQHWSIARDLDIVCLDAGHPFGNGHCLPRGLLREPPSALSRADCCVLSRAETVPEGIARFREISRQQGWGARIVEANHEPIGFHDVFSGRREDKRFFFDREVGLVSGIGNPQSFYRTVCSLDAKIEFDRRHPDHHQYRDVDAREIVRLARRCGTRHVITTHKDAVKLRKFQDYFEDEISLHYLEIEFRITQHAQEFFDDIDRVLQR